MGDLPSDLPEQMVNAIRAGLLRIHSKKLEGAKLDACLRESYDVFAMALRDDGRELTDDILRERIPAWVFHWAVGKGWTPYPPLEHSGRSPAFRLGDRRPPAFVPVPEHKLNVQFGEYEYKVTDWYKAEIIRRLESRIAYWQAEGLLPAALPQTAPIPDPMSGRMAARAIAMDADMRERAKIDAAQQRLPVQESAASKTTDSIGVQLKRLREECNLTVEQLAEKIDIEVRSVYRHLSDKTVPYKRHISSYQRVFSKLLKRNVFINKMS